METSITINKDKPALAAVCVAEYLATKKITVKWTFGDANNLKVNKEVAFFNPASILRFLGRSHQQLKLYGQDDLQNTEVDHWLNFAYGQLSSATEYKTAVTHLDNALKPVTFLVGQALTLGDCAVWEALHQSSQWQSSKASGSAPAHVLRYYNFLCGQKPFKDLVSKFKGAEVKEQKPAKKTESSTRKEEGKFVDLPGAEMGKVTVRFPPEASGYLHIGHAKAALLNMHYRDLFKGTLIMRFDDTNPAKENAEFEKVILGDLELLGFHYDKFSYTSDHFDSLLGFCERMMKEGKAYVDDTEPLQMKQEREERFENNNRSNDVAKNLAMWGEMKAGSAKGTKCCVRAKLNMKSDNGCMRDPTIYRCKPEPHVRTGSKYKVYPTYDFACPIVDSVEGVTHSLRTSEYHDRDEQFYWFIDQLGLRKPHIYEYSRMNLQNTVMSKRKLTWFVQEGLVDGWDDPRLPTVRGVLRRGMTVEGLKQFIISQGSSRSVNMMEWDKIWAINKKVIDPVVPRFTALLKADMVVVSIPGVKVESKEQARHPKNAEVGNKTVWYGPRVVIDGADADVLKEGEVVTFINWGNIIIQKVTRDTSGKVTSIDGKLNLENTDYKKTQKITWLAEAPSGPFTPTVCLQYDHIISKGVLTKEEDFKQFINLDSKAEEEMLGDPNLASLKKGEIVQLQRRGYYICDQPYVPVSPHTGRASPCIMINIPDGHQKEMPKGGSKHKGEASQKEAASSKKGKSSEKSPQTESAPSSSSSSSAVDINNKIVAAGDLVRKLKGDKAPKDQVDAAVKSLLSLKADFKAACGKDWKPGMVVPGATAPAPAAVSGATSSEGDASKINDQITAQGGKVRDLKAAKADKASIDVAVKTLLALKADFKAACGKDWKPGMVVPGASAPAPAAVTAPAASGGDNKASAINDSIVAQGNKVRDVKAAKADKATVDAEVKKLLALKADFKAACGKDWKPGMVVPGASAPAPAAAEAPKKDDKADKASDLASQLTSSHTALEGLKAQGADKSKINSSEKAFNKLKKDYKSASGIDWKPSSVSNSSSTSNMSAGVESAEALALKVKVDAQGEKVRELKTSGGDKAAVDEAVKSLLGLKAEYKTLTGQDLAGGGRQPKGGKAAKEKKPQQAKKEKPVHKPADEGRDVKKITRLGLEATKEDNLSEWYSQVITKSELIEYYDVSGCYILRPWAFAIWESIKDQFDAAIKEMGVENCYFPMFVSQAALEREKAHIADFAPEVAWVTRSGQSELAEPIAIRPTSETVMYPSYAKWIQSHRDLPLRLNQWCNVVRWEFKHPQPFLRTREFLWQEGHTAWASKEEACEEVYAILEEYAKVYEDLLAIPVVRGRKTEKEKFAGGDFTTTVEAFISASGRAIQGATSHHLGQNFSKMFDITFENPETKEKQYVYQNSWGITTRTIGVLCMVHGDNMGLVLPPKVASLQTVIVPCGVTASMSEADASALYDKCCDLAATLKAAGIRCKADVRENYSPGWKFNHWELKGVPLRLELGPRDIKQAQVVTVRRDTGDKSTLALDGLADSIKGLLDTIQSSLFAKAKADLDAHMPVSHDWSDFCDKLDNKNIIQAPFCGAEDCEDKIKKDSARDIVVEEGAPAMGAKGLCIPFKPLQELKAGTKCIMPCCGKDAKYYTLFGRSY